MATNHTPNYQLCQWEASDQVLRTDFNADNSKLDSALEDLSTSVKQHGTQISQINQKIATLGNCLIYQTSYTGTGSGAVTLTFPHKPAIIQVFHQTEAYTFIAAQGCGAALAITIGSYSGSNLFTWNGTTVSWTNAKNDALYQCNVEGETYLVMALLDAEN